MRNLVVARDVNGVIGAEGDIPWRGKLPADMAHFRRLTEGNAVIMGRLTFESIGRPLPNRHNIVISRTITRLSGCEVVTSMKEALAASDEHDESFVIGGTRVYREALPEVQRVYLTEVHAVFQGDTYFEGFNSGDWRLTAIEPHAADEKNICAYTFKTYEKR